MVFSLLKMTVSKRTGRALFMSMEGRYAVGAWMRRNGYVQDVQYVVCASLQGCNLIEQCRSNCRGAYKRRWYRHAQNSTQLH
jgi:hypothetical protein